MSKLIAKDITVDFDGEKIIENVSMSLNEGEIISLLGIAKKAGKTVSGTDMTVESVRKKKGQFFTSIETAKFMADMFTLDNLPSSVNFVVCPSVPVDMFNPEASGCIVANNVTSAFT